MFNRIFSFVLLVSLVLSCNENKTETKESPPTDSTGQQPQIAEVKEESKVGSKEELNMLPSFVVFKDWESGDLQKQQLILDIYKAWDDNTIGGLSPYFADTARFDLPDGRRMTLPNKTIESELRKWRRKYKVITNVPFSLISLHNKDFDQDWVIAWTWNKWSYTDGVKDSMLYCDNWRVKNGKIEYLNSLESRPSKSLTKKLNKIPSE